MSAFHDEWGSLVRLTHTVFDFDSVNAASQDTSLMEEDAPLQLEVLSEAETRRSSSSSEGSLAALFYPPLPHDQAAARDAASPWSKIRHSDVSKAPLTDSALPGTPS